MTRGKHYKLAIDRCPIHPQFWAIALDRPEGGGTRLTPGKCCGRWETQLSWPLSAQQLRHIAEEMEHAAEETERAEGGAQAQAAPEAKP